MRDTPVWVHGIDFKAEFSSSIPLRSHFNLETVSVPKLISVGSRPKGYSLQNIRIEHASDSFERMQFRVRECCPFLGGLYSWISLSVFISCYHDQEDLTMSYTFFSYVVEIVSIL